MYGGAVVLDSRSDIVPGTLYNEEIAYADQRLRPDPATASTDSTDRIGAPPASVTKIASSRPTGVAGGRARAKHLVFRLRGRAYRASSAAEANQQT